MNIQAYAICSKKNINTTDRDNGYLKIELEAIGANTTGSQDVLVTRDILDFNNAFAVPVNLSWNIKQHHYNSRYSEGDLTASAVTINTDIVSCVFNLAQDLEKALSSHCPGLRVVCSTFGQDLCVLIPSQESEKTVQKVIDILKIILDSNIYTKDSNISKEISTWAKQIENICNTNSAFWDTTRHREFYSSCIQTLVHREMCDSDMKIGDMLLALLVLKKCQQETYYRWVFDSGDVCIEDAAFFKEYEEELKKYSRWLNLYIEQSSQENSLANWNRAILNLTQSLSAKLIEKRYSLIDEENEEWKNDPEQLKRNFYGLYPVILTDEDNTSDRDNHDNEIFSYYPMHYSDEYCYGFLCISVQMLDKFERFIPAYTHELFHYIPPISRKKRNDIAIDLVVHSILVHLRKEINTALTERFGANLKTKKLCEDIYNCYFRNIKRYIDLGVKYYSHSEDIPLNTMNLETILPTKIFFESPLKFFEVLRRTNLDLDGYDDIAYDVVAELSEILGKNEFKRECVFIWEYECESYITTFNSVLRELRSDLAMCTILDLSLYDYLKIMANEPTWASMDKYNTADSVCIRLGIMTRLLYNNDRGTGQIFPEKEEYDNWRKQCDDCLNTLTDEGQNKEHLDNMKDYINEYVNISIEQNSKCFSDGESLLEQTLDKLLQAWKQELLSYKDIPMINWLNSVYNQNKEGTKPEWLIGTRSFLRDFYYYIPSYEKSLP